MVIGQKSRAKKKSNSKKFDVLKTEPYMKQRVAVALWDSKYSSTTLLKNEKCTETPQFQSSPQRKMQFF